MKLSFFFARRYFFSKKKTNASNIIALISVLSFTIGSMALVVVLSAFNGFEVLVDSLYHSFYPDIKITSPYSKVFEPDSVKIRQLRQMPELKFVSEVLEENVLLKYEKKQNIGTMKGVSKSYPEMVQMDSLVIEGRSTLEEDGTPFAVVGGGIAYQLSVNPYTDLEWLNVYVPKRGANVQLQPDKAFSHERILPGGIFRIEESIDNKYVFVPISFARKVLDYPSQVSAIEINLQEGADFRKVQPELEKLMGPLFSVKNRYEQNQLLYSIMLSEKLAVFLILSFILLIAAFNMTGSLYMLVIEKRRDISVLRAMGAPHTLLRNVFLAEGFLISLTGSALGMILGFLFCYLQQQYGFIKIGSADALVVEAYPVKMYPGDFVLVFFTSLLIGYITSLYPALRASRLAKGQEPERA